MLTADALTKLDTIQPEDLSRLSDTELLAFTKQLMDLQAHDRQVNQLRYYKPVSVRALGIHLSTATTIGVGGGNGCEIAGTRVVTARGTLPIEDVRVGDRLPLRGRWVTNTVTDLYTSPTAVPTYTLTTTRGYTMTASADHLNWICDARRRAWHNACEADTKTGRWVRLDELASRDLEQDPAYIKLGNCTYFPNACAITPDDAYFLGQMTGDGHGYMTGTNGMCWTTHQHDEVTIQWMERYLASRGVYSQTTDRGHACKIAWCNKGFTKLMESWGVRRSRGPEKKIPETVWNGTREVVAAFIRGFADADGCATTKPSVVLIHQSDSLMKGIHELLLRFNVVSSLRWQPPIGGPKHENGMWRVEIAGANLRPYATFINFMVPDKSARLTAVKPIKGTHQPTTYDRIEKIERAADAVVHGLTISPTPEYIADGILQHNSSKTDSCLAELVIRCTGQIPLSLQDCYPRQKLRGPINCRVVVESLTTTLFPIILPKLDYCKWQGVDQAGGPRGHWGWIPQDCLIDGQWDKSWKAHERILRLYYRDPDDRETVIGESTIQFMSYDQDPSDFASGDFHVVLHDEPPKEAIWVENMARTMRVDGTMMLAMTWPDDPTIAVDWMLDRIYEPAQPGAKRDPNIEWINLITTENRNLNQTAIARTAGQMSIAERSARIYGQPIRLSNRVHPYFTEDPHVWCFVCHDLAILDESKKCGRCQSTDTVTFQHVEPIRAQSSYPVIQVIDPHPRKPHMLLWVQITPNDDLEQVDEMEVSDVPAVVWDRVQELETSYGWSQIYRLMDPNMGSSPSGTEREVSWQEAFERVGMRIDLADDGEVGRRLFNDYLKPDPSTRRPRYTVDPRCVRTIYQLKRYAWDDHKRTVEKDQKQRAKQRHDDYPTCLKYLMNSNPSFRTLKHIGAAYARSGTRRNGY
jgi:hypothetical protein